jgi:uncharacterized beta-barrel protein YwiB (DUF1934 family)
MTKLSVNSGKKACILVLTVLTLTSLTIRAQEQERKAGDFEKISFNISGDLFIKQGNSYSVRLEGADKDLEKIVTEVDGKTLKIKTKPNTWNLGNVKVYVTLPKLTGVYLSGSGNVVVAEKLTAESIKLSVSGSGDILFKNLQTGAIDISIAGSGDVQVAGKCKTKLGISIAGSGDVDASEIEAKAVKVEISGSGGAKVYATETLESSISGSGNVRYKGNPLIDASSAGSGSTKSL